MSKTKTAEEWAKEMNQRLWRVNHPSDLNKIAVEVIAEIITTTRADERQKALTEAAELLAHRRPTRPHFVTDPDEAMIMEMTQSVEAILALRDAKGTAAKASSHPALAFIKDNVEEVYNGIGGVVGYVLYLDAEKTGQLIAMLEDGSDPNEMFHVETPKPLSQPEPENSPKRDRTADPVAGSVLGINLPYVCPSCAQPSSCRPQDHPGAYLCENPQCQVFLFLPSPRA